VSAHHCIWILFWAPCRTKSTIIARSIAWLNESPNTLFQLGIELSVVTANQSAKTLRFFLEMRKKRKKQK